MFSAVKGPIRKMARAALLVAPLTLVSCSRPKRDVPELPPSGQVGFLMTELQTSAAKLRFDLCNLKKLNIAQIPGSTEEEKIETLYRQIAEDTLTQYYRFNRPPGLTSTNDPRTQIIALLSSVGHDQLHGTNTKEGKKDRPGIIDYLAGKMGTANPYEQLIANQGLEEAFNDYCNLSGPNFVVRLPGITDSDLLGIINTVTNPNNNNTFIAPTSGGFSLDGAPPITPNPQTVTVGVETKINITAGLTFESDNGTAGPIEVIVKAAKPGEVKVNAKRGQQLVGTFNLNAVQAAKAEPADPGPKPEKSDPPKPTKKRESVQSTGPKKAPETKNTDPEIDINF